MMKFTRRILGVALVVGASATMVTACGGGEEGTSCGDGERLAAINGGAEQCYPECVDGMCDVGLVCNSGLCVAGSGNNGTNNNGTTNNGTTGATNNGTTGNNNGTTGTNNGGTNNGGTNNGGACTSELNLGACEPLCDPTGCAAGEACAIGQTGPNAPLQSVCQPAGTAGAGEACDQATACQAGFVCGQDENGAGACQELCDPNAPACTDGTAQCIPLQQDQRLGVCVTPSDACDPLNDQCPQDQRCYPTQIGNQCVPTDGKAVGEACMPPNANSTSIECGKGSLCTGPSADDTSCLELCDPAAPACTSGTCQQLQGIDFGVCA